MNRAAPSALPAIGAIALNTFREAIRDRVLYLMVAFTLLLIGASRLLAMLTVGSELKIIKDLGLSAVSVLGVLTAVFLGVSLVFKEIERRTVFTLLASPVRRWQFLAGKYSGLLAVLICNVLLMSLALAVMLWFRGESVLPLIPALLLILVQLAIVTAFALLFSCVTNPMLAALGTLSVYGMGHLSWSLLSLAERVPPGAGRLLCRGIYYVLPNLDRLDIKAEAVHGLTLPAGFFGAAVAYGCAYAVVVVLLACWLFERRDFA